MVSYVGEGWHIKSILKCIDLRQVSVITVLATDLVRDAQARHNLAPTVSGCLCQWTFCSILNLNGNSATKLAWGVVCRVIGLTIPIVAGSCCVGPSAHGHSAAGRHEGPGGDGAGTLHCLHGHVGGRIVNFRNLLI